ncbi:hypothetical protein EV368DRAFT_38108 [Lentinula lateritia]|uniref:Uncharacterized protein n=1 Tax=Lentinula aff. lateritia TaxID=2804960 RepID=A0ACC1U6C8_9AGAR|nr:hypothetical protein F5876DRAFT_75022 [Lentinula aff. lateritia]KAJ3853810.1 hypothetical protein EV368DRAFT_38108 [Lentinula lateritia]
MAATAVSSSSTLWATASKDWVIQPKPKPGRKPKNEVVIETVEDADGKGRRVQNRAAQRAFRERKQSQLAELQARIQLYEQGEIERNVALQNIAKRLKEENEALRRENAQLKERLDAAERGLRTIDKRHWRDDSPTSSIGSGVSTRKRQRIDDRVQDDALLSHLTTTFSSASPPSMASSPGSNDTSDTPFSPIPLDHHHLTAAHSSILNLSTTDKYDSYADHSVFMSCGFCSEHLPCVCRDAFPSPTDMVPKSEIFENTAPGIIRIGSPVPHGTPSILDELPAFQPAVPLRRRQAAASVPVKPVVLVPTPTCSGDPNNCLACADDSFGKAFCDALGKSVAAQASSGSTSENLSINPAEVSLGSHELVDQQAGGESISTSDAWKQLKSHPNVAFSDLALLADVVARRSKCTGPRVVISPAPGSITPERIASPDPLVNSPEKSNDSEAVVLTDPHALFRKQEKARSSPPRLVPQEILMQCGQERLRQVQAAGVREALRLLDAKYATL